MREGRLRCFLLALLAYPLLRLAWISVLAVRRGRASWEAILTRLWFEEVGLAFSLPVLWRGRYPTQLEARGRVLEGMVGFFLWWRWPPGYCWA